MEGEGIVIFAVLPFIIYLFIAVPNYRRSIIAIVGVEDNAAWLLRDASLITLILILGCLLPFAIYRGWREHALWKTAAILAGWGVASFPYLIYPSVTISGAAAAPQVQLAILVGAALGAVILVPSLWLLFSLFKGKMPGMVSAPKAGARSRTRG